MIEELKMVSEILSNLSEGALQGMIFYLGYSFLSQALAWGTGCITLYKVTKLIFGPKKGNLNVVEIIEK